MLRFSYVKVNASTSPKMVMCIIFEVSLLFSQDDESKCLHVQVERQFNECSSSLQWNKDRVRELEMKITALQEVIFLFFLASVKLLLQAILLAQLVNSYFFIFAGIMLSKKYCCS